MVVAANLGRAVFTRLESIDPAIVIHGSPGGVPIVDPSTLQPRPFDIPAGVPDRRSRELLAGAEVVIGSRLSANLPALAPRLKWVHLTGTGVDGAWHPFLANDRYILTTSKGIHAIGVSEFVLASMLASAREMRRLFQQDREARWEKFRVGELHGRTLLLLGTGEIGQAIAARARPFGMTVVGVRRHLQNAKPKSFDTVVAFDDAIEFAREADYVVNSLPLTEATKGSVDRKFIDAMPPRCVFINIGRAATVDDQALRAALAERRLRGAVLDVHIDEPLPADDPLWGMEHVLVTPHSAGLTENRENRAVEIIAENLRRYLGGRPMINVVDKAAGY